VYITLISKNQRSGFLLNFANEKFTLNKVIELYHKKMRLFRAAHLGIGKLHPL
jgi:hypothetical protein